jgi:hypothetical protein
LCNLHSVAGLASFSILVVLRYANNAEDLPVSAMQ